MMKVGYIGLGLMGKSMARNILNAGFPLVVHNRSSGAIEELSQQGAIPARSPSEVAAQVDVIFTNLPDSSDVETVVLDKNGILDGAHSGMIFVDNSTIKPATSRRIATILGEKGIESLDAPVSGGDIGARDGTLTIRKASEVLEHVMPILLQKGQLLT
jgi:2-hydroxy-3-oxopropionate reductase